jgi:transcriptional regulator with XRE-family HTH domain
MAIATIRKLRKNLGLSQEAFAKLIGKSYASVRNYEDGRKLPPDVMGRMLSLAVKAGLSNLAHEIEKEAAELYEQPIEAQAVAESTPEGDSPEQRRRMHALLDYLLDSTAPETARSLRQVLRMYSIAAHCMNDPFIDVPEEFEGGVAPAVQEKPAETRPARYRVILPVELGDGLVHQPGEIVTLDLPTAKEHCHALLSVEEGAEHSSNKKLA